jgi:glycosyltransferase involved in cell wall biosynthesis
MTEIAVYHPHFGYGGSESVCMHVLEALQRDYDVTLVTFRDLDLSEQNDHFRTDVDKVQVTRADPFGPAIKWSFDTLEHIFDTRFGRLHSAAFDRLLRPYLDQNFDITFATGAELTVNNPSIQYVHYPWYGRKNLPEEFESTSWKERVHDRLCEIISGHDFEKVGNQRLLTNSNWTAQVLKQVYGVPPETIYPPVVTDDFYKMPWEERERGFVSIGRVTPSKQVHRNIKIIDKLRDRHPDVHLHIIGPLSNECYPQWIHKLAKERSYVTIEGKVPRDRLVDLVCTHRYGIHGMEYEHFGIAVAELVAGGTIPFVPNSGGQREIVNQLDDVTYNSVADAVEKADMVLSDSDSQKYIRKSLPNIEKRFGPERFKREIQDIVVDVLHRG